MRPYILFQTLYLNYPQWGSKCHLGCNMRSHAATAQMGPQPYLQVGLSITGTQGVLGNLGL